MNPAPADGRAPLDGAVPGDRIVVRYRLGGGAPADWRASPNPPPSAATGSAVSDVTGILLVAADDELSLRRGDETVVVPRDAVVSVRRLSRRVVRNSEIRDVERALCDTAPATERAELAGWTLLATPDGTDDDAAPGLLRANSAVPVEFGAASAAVDEIRDWYADRDLPARAVLPDRLVRAGSIPIAESGPVVEILVRPLRADGSPAPVAGAVPAVVDEHTAAVEVHADGDGPALARAAGYQLHHTGRAVIL